MHVASKPVILYFGAPVVLISSVNQDGSCNLAPMSSAWWLGWRCVLGLAAGSLTPRNMMRTGECALNLPVKVQCVHLDQSILMAGEPDRVDPDKWRRLIMSFQQFYGLGPSRLHDSELAKIPESMYRAS